MAVALTKEQVEFVEKRLIEDGVTLWDIRIEMLDHIVTDIEQQMTQGATFEHALPIAFEKLGWNGSFDAVVQRKQSVYSTFNRREIAKELKDFFVTISTFFNYASLIALCYYFLEERMFIKVALLSKIVIFIAVLIFSLVHYKKVFTSASLLASFSFLGVQIAILNCALVFPKIFFDYSELSNLYLTAVLVILYPLFFVGYKTFFWHYRKTNHVYAKLTQR